MSFIFFLQERLTSLLVESLLMGTNLSFKDLLDSDRTSVFHLLFSTPFIKDTLEKPEYN